MAEITDMANSDSRTTLCVCVLICVTPRHSRTISDALTLAAESMSTFNMSMSPVKAAQCSGEYPFYKHMSKKNGCEIDEVERKFEV